MELTGLSLNNRFNPTKPASWVDARNILLNKGWKSFANEGGFNAYVELPMPMIGIVNTGIEQVVWLTNNIVSEIGIIKDSVYTPIIRDPRLKFNREYPIQGVYTYNYLGNLIVAWTDNKESPKILNLHNLPFKNNLTNDLAISNTDQFTLIELFPDVSTPVINVESVTDGGGNLKSGVYYIAIAYGYEDDSLTNWLNISQPVSIIADNSYQGYADIEGCPSEKPTNKSIAANVINIDVNFSYLHVAILYKSNGIISAGYKIAKYPINRSTIRIDIQTLDKATPVPIAEILSPSNSYTRVGTMTTLQDELIISDLETIPDIDFQPYANKIQIEWFRGDQVSLDSQQGSYKDPITIIQKKSFRADEVYGFLAGLRLKKGGLYKLYHIPGRPAHPGDKDYLNSVDNPEEMTLDTQVQRFQVHNTALDTSGNGTRGRMGYWENRDESYPSYFPPDVNDDSLANAKIRHHKFPSLRQLEEWGSNFVINDGSNPPEGTIATCGPTYGYIPVEDDWIDYYLTFDEHDDTVDGSFDLHGNNYTALKNQYVNFEVNLDIRGIIPTGWIPAPATGTCHINITKRDANNNVLDTIIDAESNWVPDGEISSKITAIFNGSTYLTEGQRINIYIYFIGNGVPDPNFPGTCDITIASTDQYQVPQGTSFSKPLGIIVSNIIIPDEIKPYVDGIEIFYFERTIENMSVLDQSILIPNDWNAADGGTLNNEFRFHGFDILSNRLPIKPTHLSLQLDFNRDFNTVTDYLHSTTYSSYNEDIIYKISKTTLLPAHNVATTPNNWTKENCLYIQTTGFIPDSAVKHSKLVNLNAYKKNMYYNMMAQRVVSTGFYNNIENIDQTSQFTIYGGDTFISPYAIITYRDASDTPPMDANPTNFLRRIYNFPCESISNIGFRYEGLNPNERFYPKSDIHTNPIFDEDLVYETGNWYSYNNDYNSLHNVQSVLIDDRHQIYINTFPDRVARSLPMSTEGAALRWRNFIATNYYDMPANKGRVNNLVAYGKSLFIRQERATYRAFIKDMLSTLGAGTYLTSGDIFDRAPEELIPINEGYLGCQSKFSDIVTKHGAIFVDRERGKIWIVGDGIKEITLEDVDEFFASELGISVEEYINYPLLYNFEQSIIAKTGEPILYRDSTLFNNIINSIDNPYKDKGIILGYDEKNERLLVTKKDIIVTPDKIYDSQTKELATLIISAKTGGRLEPTYTGRIKFTLNDTVTIDLLPVGMITDPTTQYLKSVTRPLLLESIQEAIEVNLGELSTKYTVTLTNNDVVVQAVDDTISNTITDVEIDSGNIGIAELLPDRYIYTDNAFTLSYLMNKYWVAFHDYLPNFYINDRVNLFTIQNNLTNSKMMKTNSTTKVAKYFDADTVFPSYIDFAVNNKENFESYIIDAVKWQADMRDINTSHLLWDKTISHVMIYTENQCSNLIPIVRRTFGLDNGNTTFDHYWVFNVFRDEVLTTHLPFITKKGILIHNNIADCIPTTILPGMSYKVTILNSETDSITYNGVVYSHDGDIFKGVTGVTTFTIQGTAILKTYKYWFEKSLIIGNFVIVRLMYDNIEQNKMTVNSFKLGSSFKI